jgi:hypothetical protein
LAERLPPLNEALQDIVFLMMRWDWVISATPFPTRFFLCSFRSGRGNNDTTYVLLNEILLDTSTFTDRSSGSDLTPVLRAHAGLSTYLARGSATSRWS